MVLCFFVQLHFLLGFEFTLLHIPSNLFLLFFRNSKSSDRIEGRRKENKNVVIIPYLCKISHNLKRVGYVDVMLSAPEKLAGNMLIHHLRACFPSSINIILFFCTDLSNYRHTMLTELSLLHAQVTTAVFVTAQKVIWQSASMALLQRVYHTCDVPALEGL